MIHLLLACGAPSAPPLDVAPISSAVTEEAPAQVAERSSAPTPHGGALVAAQDAWVGSDAAGLRAALGRLAGESLPGSEAVAAPYRAAVRVALDATTGDAQRRGLADVMAACGACHVASQHVVIAQPAGLTEEETDVASFMRRHVWSMDRLREGLVGPYDLSWMVGAEALHEEGLDPQDVPDRRGAALAAQLHGLAGTARDAAPPDRARIYAEMLDTCVACHQFAGPPAPGAPAPAAESALSP